MILLELQYDQRTTCCWKPNGQLFSAQILENWCCWQYEDAEQDRHTLANFIITSLCFVPWLPVVLNRNVWRTACLFIHWFWIITKANVIINLQPFKSSTRCCSKNWVYTFNGLDYWIKNLMFFGKNCMKSLLQKWAKFQVLCNSIPEL